MEQAVPVVEVNEELDLSTIARWEDDVEAAGRKSRTVVLDLTSVPFIDSAGVRTLFRWAFAAERVGIDLIVVAPPGSPVRRLLAILEPEPVPPIADSRRGAVHARQGPGWPGPRRITNGRERRSVVVVVVVVLVVARSSLSRLSSTLSLASSALSLRSPHISWALPSACLTLPFVLS